jgi:hypothetical protein
MVKINWLGYIGYLNQLTNVILIEYSTNYVSIESTGIPSYRIGPWNSQPGPYYAAQGTVRNTLPRYPSANNGTLISVPVVSGVMINGVTIMDGQNG